MMHGSIRQRKGLDTLVHGTGVLAQKGAWPLPFAKQEVAGKARKTKRVSEADWVTAAGSQGHVRTAAGLQLNISQAKGMGTDFRTKRSHAETCMHSRLEGR